MATTVQPFINGPLGGNPYSGQRVVQFYQQAISLFVLFSTFDPQGPLTHCGEHQIGGNDLPDTFFHTEPFEPGRCQNDAVEISFVKTL